MPGHDALLASAGNIKVSSLDGIEYFTSLETLICNYVTSSLNVSKNTALKSLSCAGNNLSTLDVSKNTALETLNCGSNKLSNLDVSRNTELKSLSCAGNNLSALDVSKNTALETLRCSQNNLATLDVSKNTALKTLECGGNNSSTLDVSRNTELKSLSCGGNNLSTLDVSKNTALETLSCGRNNLATLDVSKNMELKSLSCGGNNLSTLDVSKNTVLETLSCSDNNLTALDMSKNMALKDLSCERNNLTVLDVSKSAALEFLDCRANGLTTLDVSNCMELRYLICHCNQLSRSVDASKNLKLGVLFDNPQWKKQVIAVTQSVTKKLGDGAFSLDAKLTQGDGKLTYVSSDPKVAEVSDTGIVTVKGAGTANITVRAEQSDFEEYDDIVSGDVPPDYALSDEYRSEHKINYIYLQEEAIVKLTVNQSGGSQSNVDQMTNPVKINSIKLSAPSNKIAAGKKVKLTAKISPANAANKKLTWKSSNTKIAKVSQNGTVTMQKNSGGKKVTITAAAADGSNTTATYKITSMKGVVKKIAVTGNKQVKAGKSLKLKAKVTASKGANKKVAWSSSNTKYAKVSSSGKVTTLKAGKGKNVKITCASLDGSNKKKTVTIKIK